MKASRKSKNSKTVSVADRVRSRAKTKPISSSDLDENLRQRRSQIREFEQGWGRFRMGFIDGCLRNKWPDKKNFLAMPIHSDMKAGGVSLGTISRGYEGVGHSSVYPYFERLFRSTLRGHGLFFQWDSGECSVYSQ
jgi:hypothetical protein